MPISNARIHSTMLGIEDHGILTFSLELRLGSAGRIGWGGWGLDYRVKDSQDWTPEPATASFIRGILSITDADRWENLQGKHIRLYSEREFIWTSQEILAVGHILEDKWLAVPKDEGGLQVLRGQLKEVTNAC